MKNKSKINCLMKEINCNHEQTSVLTDFDQITLQ